MGNARATAVAAAVVLACSACGVPGARTSGSDRDGFVAALDAADAAQLEFQHGRPEAYKALWSHADDVTLAGGFGGVVEKGWAGVSRRLDWASAQFSRATHENERIAASSSGDLGYVVQREKIRYVAAGQATEMQREYRVTMVLRREAAGWRIVHRQADVNVAKQAPSR